MDKEKEKLLLSIKPFIIVFSTALFLICLLGQDLLAKTYVQVFHSKLESYAEELLDRAEKHTKEIEPEMKNIKQLKQILDDYINIGLKNYNFGKQIANVADYVCVVNKTNRDAIINGLLSQNYNKERVFEFDDFKSVFDQVLKLANKNCVVLIENDLPDSYK